MTNEIDVLRCDCEKSPVIVPSWHELIPSDYGILRIGYKGECPYCKKAYHWTSLYSFEEMIVHLR